MRKNPARRSIGLVAACSFITLGLPVVAVAQVAPSAITVVNNETQPVYRLADALHIVVNIETSVDTDKNGQLDRVQMRVARPNTAAGVKVATIIEPSPYYGSPNDSLSRHAVNVNTDAPPPLAEAIRRRLADQFSGVFGPDPNQERLDVDRSADAAVDGDWDLTYESYTDNYFIPRGYAVAELDALGTGGSSGCPGLGSPAERAGVKAAVDWLNGRAKGYAPNGVQISATDWSTGNAALKGKSYDGALAIEGAASGVSGLKTILSVAGISDWYGYTRANGGVVNPAGADGYDVDNLATWVNTGTSRAACHDVIRDELTAKLERDTGDRTQFWKDRDQTKSLDNSASVFLVHGMRDDVVRPSQAISYWEALQQAGRPSKLWVTQGSHLRPYNMRKDEYVRQTHHWFDYWLYGVPNGIMAEPKVDIQNDDLTTWTTQTSWPATGTSNVVLKPQSTGALSKASPLYASHTMTDRGVTDTVETILDKNGMSNANSLAYITPALNAPVVLQGTPTFSVNAALDGPSPYITALLVDYGPQNYLVNVDGYYDQDKNICAGESIAGNTGCSHPYTIYKGTTYTDYRVIGRSWIDARNWTSDALEFTLLDGTARSYTWKSEPINYTVPQGHKLGVVFMSTDYVNNLRYNDGTTTRLSVTTGLNTSVSLPVKSGGAALG